MSVATTPASTNTTKARFLAPETHQRAARAKANERQRADAVAVDRALAIATWRTQAPFLPSRMQARPAPRSSRLLAASVRVVMVSSVLCTVALILGS